MSKLSHTQLTVLTKAAARTDGAACVPLKMNKLAAAKLGASLMDGKLAREIRAKSDMPVWRKDEDGRLFSLVIAPAGRKIIGAEDGAVDNRRQPTLRATLLAKSGPIKSIRGGSDNGADDSDSHSAQAKRSAAAPVKKHTPLPDPARPVSKRQLLIDLLSRPDGATIDEMVRALGWLPHTTRAELTRLRHQGFSISRTPRENQASLYSLAAPAASPAPMKVGQAA